MRMIWQTFLEKMGPFAENESSASKGLAGIRTKSFGRSRTGTVALDLIQCEEVAHLGDVLSINQTKGCLPFITLLKNEHLHSKQEKGRDEGFGGLLRVVCRNGDGLRGFGRVLSAGED
jgi:hypothetical protein